LICWFLTVVYAYQCMHLCCRVWSFLPFFLLATTTAQLYSLSLHDALPISVRPGHRHGRPPPLHHARPRDRPPRPGVLMTHARRLDRKSTRLNSSHVKISYAVFCLKKKKHR